MRIEYIYDPWQAEVAHRIAELRAASRRTKVVDTEKHHRWGFGKRRGASRRAA